MISRLTQDLQIVGIDADPSAWPADPSWSRIVSRPGMLPDPARRRTDGRLGRRWIDEAARVVAPLSRVVVTDAAGETYAWLEGAGLKVMMAEKEAVVATRS